ncbi:hypothetical protein [Diaminobutyricimonas sp. LJ205]|uniref:type IV toxin-antitoxin system AbiEi family antitoxin domain-containing protein n=1 Tax=Diaminobutyricimonas sp. LJ205 TaxID=2683590 RepID=UPI0012F52AEE|nr:hypothetical protein [Diaminobutyricimonas sp. LJ205]
MASGRFPELRFVHALTGIDETRHQLARAARRGLQHRVARGVYTDTARWTAFSPRQQYLARVLAIADTRHNRPVISHWSAAALHGLPALGGWPATVHITTAPTSTARSRGGVVKHALALGDADVVEIDGMLVTSLERTIVDIAVAATFMTAVVMADHALLVDRFARTPPLTTKAELIAAWDSRLPFKGHRRAELVLEFAETKSHTPIESVSRVNMFVIGCPRPELQVPHYDHDGFVGDPDFTWKAYRMLGEADGDRKYLDEAYRSGRTVEEVLRDEKIREDRLRALGNGMSRWRWKVARDPGLLRRHLLAAGLPMGIPWR